MRAGELESLKAESEKTSNRGTCPPQYLEKVCSRFFKKSVCAFVVKNTLV